MDKNKDSVLGITLLLILLQWKMQLKYGLIVIAIFIIVAILSNSFSALCHKAWISLAKILNFFSSFLLLLIVYLFVILPTALYLKISKKSGIKMKPLSASSNFVKTDKTYSKEDMADPW
ncbi:MAG: hypothetical protein QM726_07075 [Chitinophagaceae bacterium]